jgi:hypothetical protein
MLAAALEANQELARLVVELREENARLRADNVRLRERDARRDAELEKLRADLAVLQRMLFGRSSERSCPRPPGGDEGGGDEQCRLPRSWDHPERVSAMVMGPPGCQ